jgi:hypothetical protein
MAKVKDFLLLESYWVYTADKDQLHTSKYLKSATNFFSFQVYFSKYQDSIFLLDYKNS